jgi:hypothetical protein
MGRSRWWINELIEKREAGRKPGLIAFNSGLKNQRTSAKHVLELWRQGQDAREARSYLAAISDLAAEADSAHRSVDEKDLPKP